MKKKILICGICLIVIALISVAGIYYFTDGFDSENPASDFEYSLNETYTITIDEYTGLDPKVIIPEKIDGKKVTVIGMYAFSRNNTITSVKMPDSITKIDALAFEECKNLVTVKLSNNLKEISGGAFLNCSALKNIVLPDSLTALRSQAFEGCSSLKEITIPGSVST